MRPSGFPNSGVLTQTVSPCQAVAGLKPRIVWLEVARLKSCPDTKPDALGQPPKVPRMLLDRA